MASWKEFEGLKDFEINSYEYNVAKSLLLNELGSVSNGYQLSHAKIGQSGWSFGGQQMDLSKGRGVELFKDIIEHELGSDFLSSNKLNNILFKKGNSNALSSNLRTQIDTALSSDYAKTKIDEIFVSDVKKYINYADKVEIELQKINPDIELSLGEKSMIIDFHNQYRLSLDNSVKGSMLKKMQNVIADKGDITLALTSLRMNLHFQIKLI